MFLINTLISSLLIVAIVCEEKEDDEEILLKNILSFNDDYLADIRDEYSRIVFDGKEDDLSIKIGILAMYFRVYKKVVQWGTDGKGFEHLYPVPLYDFDFDVAALCKIGLVKCIESILYQINSTAPWILQNSVSLEELALAKIIDNQRIGLEISASQVLCALTNSRIASFEYIPYCNYRVEQTEFGPKKWHGKSFFREKLIDEFVGGPFQCATESFCPDPCCLKVPEIVRKSTTYKPLCALNTCREPGSSISYALCVYAEPHILILARNFENDYLFNLRQNKFNISCGCEEESMIYRPDIGECVHHNPCNKISLCRENFQECVNIHSGKGYKCVCQLGYRMTKNKECVPLEISIPQYFGHAYSQEMEKDTESSWLFL
ncbi:unnamed protein product [Caenorhabditis bovis]|uniref:EGF-like domain-containing protein n=1 Tax=Caenorhabditis bovis TaxID=2654633 RepID=A0A8S1EXB3_9PELO|nr:unnamed protein product [Caenorhabditis bovis]